MTTVAEVLRQQEWTLLVLVKDGDALAVEHLMTLALTELRKVEAFLDRTASVGPLGYPEERSRKLTAHIFRAKADVAREIAVLLRWSPSPRHHACVHEEEREDAARRDRPG